MSNPDDAQYMRMLIQRAQELVDAPAPKKEKAKRNISEERKEELRQRMIALREKSIVSRQAKAKSKTQPKEEEAKEVVKEVPKEEVKTVQPTPTPTPPAPQAPPVVQAQPVVQAPPAPVVPAKVYPKYYLPTMKYAKKHGFF